MDKKYGTNLELRDELIRSPLMALWQVVAPEDYYRYVAPAFWNNPEPKTYTLQEILAELGIKD